MCQQRVGNHGLDCLGCITNGTAFNIVEDIGVNSRPVDISSFQMCHLVNALVAVM